MLTTLVNKKKKSEVAKWNRKRQSYYSYQPGCGKGNTGYYE